MTNIMTVKDLKESLDKIPNDYEIKTRSRNAHLCNDEDTGQLSFAGEITKVKVIDIHRTVMLIRSFE